MTFQVGSLRASCPQDSPLRQVLRAPETMRDEDRLAEVGGQDLSLR